MEFIVVAKDFRFAEALKIDAVSAEDAVFNAAKRMKASNIVFVKPCEELRNFVTNCYYGALYNYVVQLENGTVEVGGAEAPNYKDKQPYEKLDVCWAVDRLLKNESTYPRCRHVIVGERLPQTIISSTCYYCGDDSTSAYF